MPPTFSQTLLLLAFSKMISVAVDASYVQPDGPAYPLDPKETDVLVGDRTTCKVVADSRVLLAGVV